MKQFLFLLIFTAFIPSCKAVNENTDSLNDAKQLLNQGEYEKVIGLLADESEKTDSSSELKILLASAYAGSIGLNLVDSYPAFEELLFKGAIAARTSATELLPKQESTDDMVDQQKAEQELLNMVTSTVAASRVIFGLKWIPPIKRPRIFSAARQLDKIENSDRMYKSASIYRLIVFSSLFMSTFRDGLSSPEKIFENPTEFFCDLNTYKFAENLARMQIQLRIIEGISKEYIAASPSQPAPLQKIISIFGRIRNFLTSNRDPITLASFLHGALRNEICK